MGLVESLLSWKDWNHYDTVSP